MRGFLGIVRGKPTRRPHKRNSRRRPKLLCRRPAPSLSGRQNLINKSVDVTRELRAVHPEIPATSRNRAASETARTAAGKFSGPTTPQSLAEEFRHQRAAERVEQ